MSTTTGGDTLIIYCAMGCGATAVTSADLQRRLLLSLMGFQINWMCPACADKRRGKVMGP